MGAGSLIKVGSGVLTLTGQNTYSGTTNVTSGNLVVTAPQSLSGYNISSMVTAKNGGTLTLRIGGSGWTTPAINTFLSANRAGFALGSALGIDTTNSNFTYAGTALSGNLGLTKLGANTLTLTGISTYGSPTLVSAGTLQLGDGIAGHDGSLASTGQGITDNSTLVYDLAGLQTYSGALGGSGIFTKAGSGVLLLGRKASIPSLARRWFPAARST